MNYSSSAKIPLWRPAWSLLCEHRDLIRSMVRRDLTSRYKGSVMGSAWAIITPAVQIVIFTVIFSGIFSAKFGEQGGSDGVLRSTTALTDNINLVRRVVFPLEALPVNLAFSALMQQLLGTIVLLLAAVLMQRTLHATAFWLPVLLIPQLLATIGLGWLMASLGVFIRDMTQVNQLALQACMYLTPILYPESLVPSNYRWLVDWNPMAPLIRSYRLALLEGQMPDWRGLSVTLAFGLICFGFGYWWFERTKKAFADVL